MVRVKFSIVNEALSSNFEWEANMPFRPIEGDNINPSEILGFNKDIGDVFPFNLDDVLIVTKGSEICKDDIGYYLVVWLYTYSDYKRYKQTEI